MLKSGNISCTIRSTLRTLVMIFIYLFNPNHTTRFSYCLHGLRRRVFVLSGLIQPFAEGFQFGSFRKILLFFSVSKQSCCNRPQVARVSVRLSNA